MFTAAGQRKKNDSKGAAYSVGQQKSSGTRTKGFVDNRPETKKLRQLKEKIQNKKGKDLRNSNMNSSGHLNGENPTTEGDVSQSTTESIQRKIGAEIEVPGATLDYPEGTGVTQGEKVGAIVPGIETEIHLEAPGKNYATFEMATGLHDQYPPEHPLSLTFQVGYLADFVDIAKMRKKSFLKDMPLMALEEKWAGVNEGNGPILNVAGSSQGAFQINVSPTKETSSAFLDIFDVINSFSYEDDVLKVQERAVNDCLHNAKLYSTELYTNIVDRLSGKLNDPLPSILKSTIKALVNVPRVSYFNYLKAQEGWGSPTEAIIDKNILDVLPRANIQELWIKTLSDPAVEPETEDRFHEALADAFEMTDFPELVEGNIPSSEDDMETYQLLERVDSLNNERPEGWMDQLMELNFDLKMATFFDKIKKGPNIFHAKALKKEGLRDTLAVLAGEKILVRNRKVTGLQAEAILKNTDSSLLPVGEEEGEAGVFEIRNPFTSLIPVDKWAEVMAAYEGMLYENGVRY